jgi:hypothetical protein
VTPGDMDGCGAHRTEQPIRGIRPPTQVRTRQAAAGWVEVSLQTHFCTSGDLRRSSMARAMAGRASTTSLARMALQPSPYLCSRESTIVISKSQDKWHAHYVLGNDPRAQPRTRRHLAIRCREHSCPPAYFYPTRWAAERQHPHSAPHNHRARCHRQRSPIQSSLMHRCAHTYDRENRTSMAAVCTSSTAGWVFMASTTSSTPPPGSHICFFRGRLPVVAWASARHALHRTAGVG